MTDELNGNIEKKSPAKTIIAICLAIIDIVLLIIILTA